eukprot:CAMPEP_0197404196 /NCGR_PEP_ID=MMETSP1165-20131217/22612_1 /TAXON_ID=284809 /ORGANISM="Chrysocystis fragilis, Strain CCMP3189" /LENGTH=69 /DNA_ID=CAMNT_0042930453 /DNA_START=148 /DNA_END=357 /DNA_ORIENTATION=+
MSGGDVSEEGAIRGGGRCGCSWGGRRRRRCGVCVDGTAASASDDGATRRLGGVVASGSDAEASDGDEEA